MRKALCTGSTCGLVLLCALSVTPASAQDYELRRPEPLTRSMGMPPIWKPYAGAGIALDRRGPGHEYAGEVHFGLYRDVLNPIAGVVGIVGEAFARAGTRRTDGGLRVLGASRFFFIQAGAEYSIHHDELNFLWSLTFPMRRGGPLRRGGAVRIDWVPAADHSLTIGLSIPVGQPRTGRTRPYCDYVRLPRPSGRHAILHENLDSHLEQALERLGHAAHWIRRYTTPFLDQSTGKGESEIEAFLATVGAIKDHLQLADADAPHGHTFEAEVEVYHRELERAFGLAAFGTAHSASTADSRTLTTEVRRLLLHEVIFPYNRLLGQMKKHDSMLGFGQQAESQLADFLARSPNIPVDRHALIRSVFRHLIGIIEDNRRNARHAWKDSRLVWIPMHYALRFEDHDTEDELDSLIEEAVQRKFTSANDVHYVINELFQPELERMIHAARDYHVLWIHDITGVGADGRPDSVTFRMVHDGYLRALTDRVREYDSTGTLPSYFIFLDQNYFEARNSRLWLALLEDPLGYRIRLPDGYRAWEAQITEAQNDLREAVSESRRLRARARRYGDAWLHGLIKAHVNITHPSDLSFRSRRIFKNIPTVPDNVMRDHRKIAFYDVTELDPARGEAIYTGMGVGRQYVGPTWDDRSILARGPAILTLKEAVRDLLFTQGFQEEEIPPPLQARPLPDDYGEQLERLRARGWTATAMQVHNATGFGPKYGNVVRAMLYNLMPSGSHYYIPDSLWNGPYWGSMLIGAALRGCIVLVVSPALENAPSAGNPQMSRANELFTRFFIIQEQMKEEIEAAGGLFRVGIYSMDLDVADIAGKIRGIGESVATSEVFRRVFPFAPSVLQVVAEMPAYMEASGLEARHLDRDELPRKPRLHFKSQFFASAPTIRHAIPLEGWAALIRKYILARVDQVDHRETGVDAKDLRRVLREEAAGLMANWSQGLTAEERGQAMIYLTVGSQNQDYRSMVMDGEAMFVVGRAWAMVAYLDFVSLMGQTTWVEDLEQLEDLLPRQTGFWRWVGRYIKLAL